MPPARAILPVLLFSCELLPARAETLTYIIAPDFGTGRTRVEVVWETAGRGQSALGVAASFGRIDNVASMLTNVAVDGAEKVRKQDNLWICTHKPGARLRVTYVVNPRRAAFDDWEVMHRPIASESFFCGIGGTFLLAPNSGSGVPAEFETTLSWRLPAGFSAVCSWGARRVAGGVMKPADLRQSVYVAGRLATKTTKAAGFDVTVAMADGFGFSIDEFAKMTAEIIGRQCDFMRESRFPDFVITAVPVGKPLREGEARLAGSGLYNSFALFVAPEATWNDAIEHLFAHELFHFWNGRTLKAAEPERRCYWFVEGMTDYYALRILHDSKFWSAATYAKWLNKHLREYAANPAANASNDEINEKYWTHRDTIGQAAYQRGHLLGLRWHHLAKQRGVAGGLDRWFLALIERGRGGAEVTNESLRKAGVELLGAWFGTEFDKYVVDAATIDVPADALAPGLIGRVEEVMMGKSAARRVLQFRPAE